MSRLQRVSARYLAVEALMTSGVELLAVADAAGTKLDSAINQLRQDAQDDDPAVFSELLAVSRQLRWRIATEPFPTGYSHERETVLQALLHLAARHKLSSTGYFHGVLDDLVAAATAVGQTPPTADVLLESLMEADAEDCVIITASARARDGMTRWLGDLGVTIPVVRGTDREVADVVDQAYAAGPPRIFGSSLLSSPRARALTYIFPSWVRNRGLPASTFSAHAQGAVRLRARLFTIGQAPAETPSPAVEDGLVPAPLWPRSPVPVALGSDEVLARRVLLGGGLAIMLDQGGEHIRTFDPARPSGERVEFRDVSTVTPGSYLVLREGATESEALFARAIDLLGGGGSDVLDGQQRWKDALDGQLDRRGRAGVIAALRRVGVRAADQAPTWTARTVARPQADRDFELLLGWLSLPLQPHLALANRVRRARLQAMADVREALEEALSVASMDQLDRNGYLRLDLSLPGFAGIIATRVLALAPFEEAVPRRELRVPFPDRSALWLE